MKKIFFTFLIFASAFAAGAQTLPSLFLDFNPESLGKASSTLATTSTLDQKFAINASYGMWQPKVSGDNLISFNASGRLGGRFALGLDGKMIMSKPYDVTSSQGITPQVDGSFTPKEMAFGLSGTFAVTDGFSLGLKAKFASSALAVDAKTNAFCGDFFLRYAGKSFKVGASVENLGGKVKYGEYQYSLPMLARLGAQYQIINGLNASLEADYIFIGAFMAGLGVEYWIKDIVAPRVGFHYGPKDKGIPTYASAGLGVKFVGVQLNASYLFVNEILGNTLCFGLGYCF